MWKEYVQPIVFVFEDAPLYPGKKTSFQVHQSVSYFWLDIQEWFHQQLGYTFSLMTPMNVAANLNTNGMVGSPSQPSNQSAYDQWKIFKELHSRGVIDLSNPDILYYVHAWGTKPNMSPIGCYDGNAWGYDHNAGRCMTQPGGLGLLDICSTKYWETLNESCSAWSIDLVKGACIHELGHGMGPLPDGKPGDKDIMWSWWKWPEASFTDEQKMKLMRSRWMWVR